MIGRALRGTALLLCNTAALLLAVNLLLHWTLGPPAPDPALAITSKVPFTGAALDQAIDELTRRGTWERLYRFHPELTPRQVTRMMVETYGRSFMYEPYTGFTERPYAGEFVNVTPQGFRLNGRAAVPWPPPHDALTVFVFGGSTTFGHSVTDRQTIPAQLEAIVAARTHRPVRVYNFGRQFYFSTQERALLERLLLDGVAPDVAVFVDGLNDYYFPSGEPQFTSDLRRFMDVPAAPRPHPLVEWVQQWPLAQLAERLRVRWTPPPDPSTARPAEDVAAPRAGAAEREVRRRGFATAVDARYLANQRMIRAIAAAPGVKPLFVWQPVPKYHYDRALHHFLIPDDSDPNTVSALYGYPAMAARRAAGELGSDFVWCADLTQSLRAEVYLDQVHYTPAMNRRIARCIAKPLLRLAAAPRGR